MKAEPEMKPSKMELDDYRNLAGMLIGIGSLVGGKGKTSAMYALSALDGMMKGYAEGRKDLVKQNQIEFDKALKAVDAHNKKVQKDFEEAISLINKDRKLYLEKIKRLTAENKDSVFASRIALNDLEASAQSLQTALNSSDRALTIANQNAQKQEQREFQQAERIAREAFQAEQNRLGRELRRELKGSKEKDPKPPPKEIVAQNQLRNSLIPKLEEALPVLDRMNKEGKWSTMTTLLALPYGTNAAEATFKDDPEALNLILTLAYFRSKEFETAGKALTRKEDQILAPIVRGDLRVYEGMRNAMSQGLKTLKQEQAGLEKTYPYLEAYNKAFQIGRAHV